jgi:hypothetical protein
MSQQNAQRGITVALDHTKIAKIESLIGSRRSVQRKKQASSDPSTAGENALPKRLFDSYCPVLVGRA